MLEVKKSVFDMKNFRHGKYLSNYSVFFIVVKSLKEKMLKMTMIKILELTFFKSKLELGTSDDLSPSFLKKVIQGRSLPFI